MIEDAGHAIFSENTDRFFAELERFVNDLGSVDEEALASYQDDLASWRRAWQASPGFVIRDAGAGSSGSDQIVARYADEWLDRVPWFDELSRVGFALYDNGRFEDALAVFTKLERLAANDGNRSVVAMALTWQGHVLDLMARREEAVSRYRQVAAMNLDESAKHDQYDMDYEFSTYAEERLLTPFSFIENRLP